MRVKILIEFDVQPLEDEAEFTENHAKSAASEAAYNYLSLVEVSGYGSDVAVVKVHAEGFGACLVALGKDHE